MEKQSSQESSAETHQSPQNIEQQLAIHAELQQEVDICGNEIDEAIDQLSKNHEELEQLLATLIGKADKDTSDSEWRTILTELNTVLDDESRTVLIPKFETMRSLLKSIAHIEQEALPLAQEQLTQQQEQFLDTVDWHAAIEAYTTSKPTDDIRPAIYHTFALLAIPQDQEKPLEFRETLVKTGLLNNYYHSFQLRGLLREEDAQVEKPERGLTTGNIVHDMRQWQLLTETAQTFIADYRKQHELPYQKMSGLLMLAEELGLNGEGKLLAPTNIAYALQDKINEIAQEYDETDKQLIQAKRLERPNALMITHEDSLKETTNIEEPRQWTLDAIKRFPDWYTAGLGFINFTEGIETPEHSSEPASPDRETNGNWHTTGHLLPYKNIIEISTHKKQYDEALATTEGQIETKVLCENLLRQIIAQTIDHELTHYAHFHTLSIEWLRRWCAATMHEEVNVTDYVTKTQNERNDTVARMEDLAVSVERYKNSPGEILLKAPLRFKTINILLQEFDSRIVGFVEKMAQTEQIEDGSLLNETLEKCRNRTLESLRPSSST